MVISTEAEGEVEKSIKNPHRRRRYHSHSRVGTYRRRLAGLLSQFSYKSYKTHKPYKTYSSLLPVNQPISANPAQNSFNYNPFPSPANQILIFSPLFLIRETCPDLSGFAVQPLFSFVIFC